MQNTSFSPTAPRDNSPRYFPLGATSTESSPEASLPPRNQPGQSERQPLSDDGLEGAKKEASFSSPRSGGGEDPFVESGVPENDPERPRETPEEQSNR